MAPKCPVCNKSSKSGDFNCATCQKWTHPKCGGMKKREVQKMGAEGKEMICNVCKDNAKQIKVCSSLIEPMLVTEDIEATSESTDDVHFDISQVEKIVRSKEVAENFIRENMPGHYIKSVPGDGFCIIHAFAEGLASIGRKESTFEEISLALRKEMQREIYANSSTVNVIKELEEYLETPLYKYDKEICDLILNALGMAFKVNVIVFRSDSEKCWIADNNNSDNNFQDTLYFVRTESMHLDPVIPISVDLENSDDRIGAQIEIDVEANADNFVYTIIEPTDMEANFVNLEEPYIDQGISNTNTKPIQSPVSSAGIEVNSLQENVEWRTEVMNANQNTKAGMHDHETSVPFNFKSPTAESLFKYLFNAHNNCIEEAPKKVRCNMVYTISSKKEITVDDNGAYNRTNQNMKNYYVNKSEDALEVNIVRKVGNAYVYRKRKHNKYIEVPVDSRDIYTLKRYYRENKSFSGLRMMLVKVCRLDGEEIPYTCVVYSRSEEDEYHPDDGVTLPHGNNIKSSTPYLRTSQTVLQDLDSNLKMKVKPSESFYQALEKSNPLTTTSPSQEPRNIRQAKNRKSMLNRKECETTGNRKKDDLETLLDCQRDKQSPVQTVVITGDHYFVFVYTRRQIDDIKIFCCRTDDDASVLGVDTTFKLCSMWLTDTSYRNKRIIRVTSQKNPVWLGPVMLHFSKDEEAFRRFCLEMISKEPLLLNLVKIGVDKEAAIYNGFKSVISSLLELYCVRHLKERDELMLNDLFNKNQIPEKFRTLYTKEIIDDIYGRRVNEVFEEGLADSDDCFIFEAKCISLKPRWEKLCPGFFDWFQKNRKDDFTKSVIKSARDGTNIKGLFYNNDIESLHAVEKRIQLKSGTVLDAVNTLKTLIERQETQERLALYGSGDFVLAPPYKHWFAPRWHEWSPERREQYIKRFRAFVPSLDQSFQKPANAGQKPGYRKRIRTDSPILRTVDRNPVTLTSTPKGATTLTVVDSPVNIQSANHTQLSKTSASAAPPTQTSSHPSCTLSVTSTMATSSSRMVTSTANIPDPRSPKRKQYTLHFRDALPKTVSKCRGNCGETITSSVRMLVKSSGYLSYPDKKTAEIKTRYSPLYIHFQNECLKSFDEGNYYAPHEEFDWSLITLHPDTKARLTEKDKLLMRDLRISYD